MTFEWDAEKAEANLAKHGISFEEAKTIFDVGLSNQGGVVSNILCKRPGGNFLEVEVGAVGTVGKRSWFFHGFHSPFSFHRGGDQRRRG